MSWNIPKIFGDKFILKIRGLTECNNILEIMAFDALNQNNEKNVSKIPIGRL